MTGVADMVTINTETDERQQVLNEVYAKLATAEAQHKAGMGRPLAELLKEAREKYL